MQNQKPTSENLPRAIVHVCIEDLYASIASRDRLELCNRPFVTGGEGSLVTSSNHLAYSLGIQKGMTLIDALEIYPSLEIVPTDFEAGAASSEAMFDAMRQLSHRVETSGLHRGFVDITRSGVCASATYEAVVRELGDVIKRRTGLPVLLGLSLNRTLAAIAGQAGSSGGVIVLPRRFLSLFLTRTPVADIPGMTTNQAAQLRHFHIITASDLASQSESWVKQLLGSVGVDLWRELQGEYVYQIGLSTIGNDAFQPHIHDRSGPDAPRSKARREKMVFPAWLDLNLAFSRLTTGMNF